MALYQDSSGGENWRSTNHLNRNGEVPLRFRGYRLNTDSTEIRGKRAIPVVVVSAEDTSLSLAMQHFWENFPKALRVGETLASLALFPAEHADVHEIQGGEQKTHAFHVCVDADGVTPDDPLRWARDPLIAHAPPKWYAASGAVPGLVARGEDPNERYLRLVDAAIEGEDSFFRKREAIDEYGWRHFGDTYADHEALFHKGSGELTSHYNNQYDAVAGFGWQFLRSTNLRWYRNFVELAWHVIDIDIYHTDLDKAAYNRGMFWHTAHYVHAGKSTHRTFPSGAGTPGGGPSPEHLYGTGLLLHHYLTGCRRSREQVLRLGQYVIDADDGRKTIFRFIDRGPTGVASWSGSDTYHGPGRGPGNAIEALLNAYQVSARREFIGKAEALIRRCVNPRDDLERLDLGNVEERWFYMVFLRSLIRYLNLKIELKEIDRAFCYGLTSLRHYVRWAASHEGLALDEPEKLDFPTETWAAQDLRKTEVLLGASPFFPPEESRELITLAERIYHGALGTLEMMGTRTRCRPMVLLLSYWYKPPVRLPSFDEMMGQLEGDDFGAPVRFVTQKRRVLRLMKWSLVAAGGAMLAAGGIVVRSLL